MGAAALENGPSGEQWGPKVVHQRSMMDLMKEGHGDGGFGGAWRWWGGCWRDHMLASWSCCNELPWPGPASSTLTSKCTGVQWWVVSVDQGGCPEPLPSRKLALGHSFFPPCHFLFCYCCCQSTSLEEFTSIYSFTERKLNEQQDEKTLPMFSLSSEASNQITSLYWSVDNAGSCAKFISRHLSISSQVETNMVTTHRGWRDGPNQRSLATHLITTWLLLDHPSLDHIILAYSWEISSPNLRVSSCWHQVKNVRKSKA